MVSFKLLFRLLVIFCVFIGGVCEPFCYPSVDSFSFFEFRVRIFLNYSYF